MQEEYNLKVLDQAKEREVEYFNAFNHVNITAVWWILRGLSFLAPWVIIYFACATLFIALFYGRIIAIIEIPTYL